MKIGVPREVKDREYRVALTPAGTKELVSNGHEVVVEQSAGEGSGFADDAYIVAGARILTDAADVWSAVDLLLKVKEPVASEYQHFREECAIFTFLHLAADLPLTKELLTRRVTALAYETVTSPDGRLPLLAPMSEIAGRLAPQAGAYHLMRGSGGRGMLLPGAVGVAPAKVVVLGAGVAGANAVAMAAGLRADVTVLDTRLEALHEIDLCYQGRVHTAVSTAHEVEQAILEADLVIGAVLVAGAKAPVLVSNSLVAQMKPGAVLVDISVDQGGCFEDTHPTTHADPTYAVHNSVFYCVANMPGAVPHTSTRALTNVTLPYILSIANQGWRDACRGNRHLAAGLNTHGGHVVNAAVGSAHGLPSIPLDTMAIGSR